jgi:hypothetical protein
MHRLNLGSKIVCLPKKNVFLIATMAYTIAACKRAKGQDGILRLVVHVKKSIPLKKTFQATRNRFAGCQKLASA